MKKERKNGYGFVLRLTYAILFTIIVLYFMLYMIIGIFNMLFKDDVDLDFILLMQEISISIVLSIFIILGYLGAFLGKNHRWANILSIVLGAITVVGLVGIFALIGGVKGLKKFKKEKPEKPAVAKTEQTPPKKDIPTQTVTGEPTPTTTEYIQSKLSSKAKKRMMITVICSYCLLLLAGILFAALPQAGNLFSAIGICKQSGARAYGLTIGLMWIALCPSIGFYFVTTAPVSLGKKAKIILFIASALLLAALNSVFFAIINTVKDHYENNDSWFIPMSMVFASLGLLVCHLLTFFRLNPESIKTEKPEKCSDQLFDVIKHVFALLIYGVLLLIKKILAFKEKQPEVFIFVSSLLLTWLAYFTAFVFAIICIAMLITVAVLYFVGVCTLLPVDTSSEIITYQDEYGDTIDLEKQPYTLDECDVYKDRYGNEYLSDDGGKTFVKK